MLSIEKFPRSGKPTPPEGYTSKFALFSVLLQICNHGELPKITR